MIAILLAGVASAAAQDRVAQPQDGGAALDPRVDKILTRLESRQVNDLHAKVVWEVTQTTIEEQDSLSKSGDIWYKVFDPVPRFKVQFKRKIVSGRADKLDEQHLFDGFWYVELQRETRTVARREIRAASAPANPYKIGEGTFPLPFGQKKADILREFSVTLVDEPGSAVPATDHLRLIPRAGSQSEKDFKVLDFWVATEGPHNGLPLKVLAGKKDGTGKLGSTITISFADIKLNEGISDSIFKIETPPGFEEIVERLQPVELPSDEGAPPGARKP